MGPEVTGADQGAAAQFKCLLSRGPFEPAQRTRGQAAGRDDPVAVDRHGHPLQRRGATADERPHRAGDVQSDRHRFTARQIARLDPALEGDLHVAAADDFGLSDAKERQGAERGEGEDARGAAHRSGPRAQVFEQVEHHLVIRYTGDKGALRTLPAIGRADLAR